MKRSLWVFVLTVVVMTVFASVAMAAGGIWTRAETPVYELPDLTLPAYDAEGIPLTIKPDVEIVVSDNAPGFVQLGASSAYTDAVHYKWVATTSLTSVKPQSVKAKEVEIKLKGLQMGTLSVQDFFTFLKGFFAEMQSSQPAAAPVAPAPAAAPVAPAPAAAPVAPAPAAAPVAPAPEASACADTGATWDTLAGKPLTVPVGCEVWISSDPATLTVDGIKVVSPTRLTFVVTGQNKPIVVTVAIADPTKTHYYLGPTGVVDISNRDGAPANYWLKDGKVVARPELAR